MNHHETKLQSLIIDLQSGKSEAVEQLIEVSYDRLQRLARKMLKTNLRVKRWNETDDVLQNALVRLHRALQEVSPDSVEGYFRLAATQIRRELIDLARHHYGPQGNAAHHASEPCAPDAEGRVAPLHEDRDPTAGPATLMQWTELHEAIEQLPDDVRTLFDLLYYQGLTQAEAAELLDVSERTIKRRWLSAKMELQELQEKPK